MEKFFQISVNDGRYSIIIIIIDIASVANRLDNIMMFGNNNVLMQHIRRL
jgi:hypothetical protein